MVWKINVSEIEDTVHRKDENGKMQTGYKKLSKEQNKQTNETIKEGFYTPPSQHTTDTP